MASVVVDENKCIGCQACVVTCPKSFGFKDGKAFGKEFSECAKAAEAGCPVDAISVEE